jgi:regulatory protein
MAVQKISAAKLLAKSRAYCARQERCQQEVRDKLYAWGGHKELAEQVVAQLIGEGFLNEARFAAHFAVSKSRQKGWGRRKVEQALRAKGLSERCIAHGLAAIDGGEERDRLQVAIAKRWERSQEADPYLRKGKLVRYFVGKGFAAEEVEWLLNELQQVG